MDKEIDRALARGRRLARDEPRAASARYDRRTRRMVVDLTNGCSFVFRRALCRAWRGPGGGAGRCRDRGRGPCAALAATRWRLHRARIADGRVRHARLDGVRARAPCATIEVADQGGGRSRQRPQGWTSSTQGCVRLRARCKVLWSQDQRMIALVLLADCLGPRSCEIIHAAILLRCGSRRTP